MSFDMGGSARSILLLLCLISLANANTSPVIKQYVYKLCEDIPIGSFAFTIVAEDIEGEALTYLLTEPNAAYFEVDKNTGNVSVVKELDAENNPLMELGVIVSDGPNETPAELNLILLDANDNKPIFQQSSYDASIREDTKVGASLFRVEATDADSGDAGAVRYSIDEVVPNRGFSLFTINGNGDVKLNGSLNYTELSTFYQLKIMAADGGSRCYYNTTEYSNSTAFAFITVVDIPDLNPEFIGLPYTGKVEEHSAVGQSVLQVTAIDPDTGVNDDIIYSIETSTADGLFQISSDDGVISVNSIIDREVTGATVTLTVKATESKQNIYGVYANTTARVQINIQDINDNRPEFYKCEGSGDQRSCVKASHFTGEVSEHMLVSIPINMMVRDPDENSRIQLLLEGEDKAVFSVEPQSTMSDSVVQLVVKQNQNLDFEVKQQMVLNVIAIDEEETSFQSTATVTINIKDTNDKSPMFLKDIYKFVVAEHSPVGTEVGNVTAEDPDTMDQGKITYRLLPDSILMYFNVKPQTGVIYVANETLLDREVRSLYSATLQARDTENKTGSAQLEITLTDINDQRPVINRDSYLVFVEEGGQFDIKIEATDADDINTANSQIVYGIVPSRYSDNFTIDPSTGVLRNLGELDREVLDPKLNGRIELNVTATDKGTPPLYTVTTVIINIEDVNDNVPQFGAPSYTFSVKEGERGAYVGSVYAEDLDQTKDFNRISFSIINGSIGSFIIRTNAEGRGYRGVITVDPDIELDFDNGNKEYKLEVEAADLEEKTAVVMVQVNLLDVNDERPEIDDKDSLTVKENITITGAVGSFTGSDKDGNHSLVYELLSMECRCGGSLTTCNSFILDPTGEVRVNPEGEPLDYEKCDQVEIKAQVVDEFTEKGHNNSEQAGKMVIVIEDINDNAPEFIHSDSVSVVFSESTSPGTPVATVSATDRDSEINGKIEFTVAAVRFEDANNNIVDAGFVFKAVTASQDGVYVGTIQISGDLDIQRKGKYLVSVSAVDSRGLYSSTVLDVFIIHEEYKVELEFTSSRVEVQNKLSQIVGVLSAATKTDVRVVDVRSDTPEVSRASDDTIILAYFVYSNGTALTSDEVEAMISKEEYPSQLLELGLKSIGGVSVAKPPPPTLVYILLGIVGGLLIVMAVLTISLMCTRRNYRRKLKAAKAMKSASMVTSHDQKSGPVLPGTNKYTMEGANPVLNLDIDTAMALGFGAESTDVDQSSLSSMDTVDAMSFSEDQTKHFTQMNQYQAGDNGLPEYDEVLSAALAQRGRGRDSDHHPMAFNNRAFSTTDL